MRLTDEEFEHLVRAHEALDQGRPEEALELLDGVRAESGERWVAAVDAWLALDDLATAAGTLETARAHLPADDLDLAFAEGRLRLHEWRPKEARAAFERVPLGELGEDAAAVLNNLALAADLEGATDDALRYETRARELSGLPAPPRLSANRFESIVREAAEDLPGPFRAAFDQVAVVIDPMPSAAVVGAPGSGHPPDLLGLYVGLELSELGASAGGELPPTIFLFQRNLERTCASKEELVEEIRITLYHELGHALGFDEEGVDGMGLG